MGNTRGILQGEILTGRTRTRPLLENSRTPVHHLDHSYFNVRIQSQITCQYTVRALMAWKKGIGTLLSDGSDHLSKLPVPTH